MIEPEIAFADITDNMDLTEDLLKYVFQYVLDNAQQELDFFTKFINPEVKERLVEEKQQLVKLKLNHAVSPIENPQKIKEQRKTVARLMTELRMRELKENVK